MSKKVTFKFVFPGRWEAEEWVLQRIKKAKEYQLPNMPAAQEFLGRTCWLVRKGQGKFPRPFAICDTLNLAKYAVNDEVMSG